MKLMKYISFLGYALILVSVIIFAVFFGTSDFTTQTFPQADLLLTWTYSMCIISALAAVLLPVVTMINNPKAMVRSLAGIGIVVVFILICYLLADDSPLVMVGGDVIEDRTQLIVSDTGLFATYASFVIAVVAIIGGEVYKLLKK